MAKKITCQIDCRSLRVLPYAIDYLFVWKNNLVMLNIFINQMNERKKKGPMAHRISIEDRKQRNNSFRS